MSETLSPLTLAGFEAQPTLRDGVLEVWLRGNADMTVSPMFGKYLQEVDAKARTASVRVVEVRLTDLYFLSSSCFQALASWILAIASRTPDQRYTVRFATHAAQGWQKRSLEAIRRVAPGVAVIV